ncbi:hypothetical protein PACILC2_41840 [Paenibacillus cisolokensis]|uniref:Transcriptional regulator n=1 Tax=Paenibacillus cisolokensis TaxID=1658519 RepID=A0ABQ4NBL5_9BACL|nr:hypothetical protein PACILC2_41840 [Paenibacillus cisolokensis]
MANNYANMERYEEAEDALVRYLEKDEEGQFLEEAEEMMELLHYELERPTKLKKSNRGKACMSTIRRECFLKKGNSRRR